MDEIKAFRTSAASRYLATRGVVASPSFLEKARVRGPEDPRDRGPDFARDSTGTCWYAKADLDRYADQRLAARQFRGAAPQPANFKRGRPEAA
jgi:hypothetical protein